MILIFIHIALVLICVLPVSAEIASSACSSEREEIERLKAVLRDKEKELGAVNARLTELDLIAASATGVCRNSKPSSQSRRFVSSETFDLALEILLRLSAADSNTTADAETMFDSIPRPTWSELQDIAWFVAGSTYDVIWAVTSFAVEASTSAFATVWNVSLSAHSAAQEFHDRHLYPSASAYQAAGKEIYQTQVLPHILALSEIWTQSLKPQLIAFCSELAAVMLAVFEGFLALTPGVLWELSSRTLHFRRGWFDIVLFMAAGVVLAYSVFFVLVVIAWRFCLRRFVWRIGARLIGKDAAAVAAQLVILFTKCALRIDIALCTLEIAAIFCICLAIAFGLVRCAEISFAFELGIDRRLIVSFILAFFSCFCVYRKLRFQVPSDVVEMKQTIEQAKSGKEASKQQSKSKDKKNS